MSFRAITGEISGVGKSVRDSSFTIYDYVELKGVESVLCALRRGGLSSLTASEEISFPA